MTSPASGFGLPSLKVEGKPQRFDKGDSSPPDWENRYVKKQKRLARRRELYRLRKRAFAPKYEPWP